MIPEDIRTLTLLDWLENDLLMEVNSCQLASSDASFRRYFRVHTPEGAFIVMDAPPDKENLEPFIRVAELMSAANVHVPDIFQQNRVDGFLLLEDFGSISFFDKINNFDKVNPDNAASLYQSALNSLLNLQTQTPLASHLPRYDEAFLKRELAIFEEWFLGQLLDIPIPDAIWQTTQDVLVASALEQPSTCVHRDFHSRNLMVLDDNALGIIDFQDAVIGPVTYDLVSLLRDCYISLPAQQVEQWRAAYYQQLLQSGLLGCEAAQFNRWFDLMGMQRHLKAIGIFSRLHLRDGKSGYLKDIPRTLDYVIAQAQAYPELAELNDFLQQQVLPVAGTIP